MSLELSHEGGRVRWNGRRRAWKGDRLGRRLRSHGYSSQCKQREAPRERERESAVQGEREKGVAKPAQWSTTKRGTAPGLESTRTHQFQLGRVRCGSKPLLLSWHCRRRFPFLLASFQSKRLTSDVETFSTQVKAGVQRGFHRLATAGVKIIGV